MIGTNQRTFTIARGNNGIAGTYYPDVTIANLNALPTPALIKVAVVYTALQNRMINF